MKYLICTKQYGEGCDYTIGCGMDFDFIEADSIQDAIEKTVYPDGRSGRSSLEGEQALEKILIIPAECVTSVDVAGIEKEVKQKRAHEYAETQKAKELSELKRLQSKYGG